jgi:hypothetical protein
MKALCAGAFPTFDFKPGTGGQARCAKIFSDSLSLVNGFLALTKSSK